MTTQSTGWRRTRVSYSSFEPSYDISDVTKEKLFKIAKKCALVFKLPSNCRYVLEQLCGVYGGTPVENRLLVWPSNALLEKRTGIAERSIRFALSKLLDLGLIKAKDSANGKRFAQRSAQGQIIRAFGFDLIPLIERENEFNDRLEAINARDADLSAIFDQITIYRRNTNETIQQISSEYPSHDISHIMDEIIDLMRITPRRGRSLSPEPFLEQWKTLHDKVMNIYITACGGNNDRHKEHTKNALNQSCNKDSERAYAKTDEKIYNQYTDITQNYDIPTLCPDAHNLFANFRDIDDMIRCTSALRGSLGVSRDAWNIACLKIGPMMAAAALVYVVQLQITPPRGAEPIKNVGGYYRSICRLIIDNKLDLFKEMNRLGKRLE